MKSSQTHSSTPKFPPNASKVHGTWQSNLNPGNIANLHKKARSIMPIWLEGVQVVYKNNLDINKVLTMNWGIGNNSPLGFRVGGEFSKKVDENIIVII